MQVYCLKYRTKREMKDAESMTMKKRTGLGCSLTSVVLSGLP